MMDEQLIFSRTSVLSLILSSPVKVSSVIEGSKYLRKREIGGVLRCSGRVSSSLSTSGTRRVTLVTNPMISHEYLFDEKVDIKFSAHDTFLI